MWIATHKCIEAMLGISLYVSLYLKLAKHYVFLIISYVFSTTKLENKRAEQVLPGSEGERGLGLTGEGVGVGERSGPNNVYTYEQM
jgi:hypothetical protein